MPPIRQEITPKNKIQTHLYIEYEVLHRVTRQYSHARNENKCLNYSQIKYFGKGVQK